MLLETSIQSNLKLVVKARIKWIFLLLVALPVSLGSASELSRFSVGGLNLGGSTSSLSQAKDQLIKELQRRTQVDPDSKAGWTWVNQSLENCPPFLWVFLKSGVMIEKELPQRLQRYLAMGGTVFVENNGLSQKELNDFREKVFPTKEIRGLAKDELLTRTFYILPPEVSSRFRTLRQAGRVVWIETPSPLMSKMTTSSREREMSIRSAINIVLYALTGSYKDDLTHMRYLMRRRKK